MILSNSPAVLQSSNEGRLHAPLCRGYGPSYCGRGILTVGQLYLKDSKFFPEEHIGFLCREHGVKLGREAQVVHGTAIGMGTVIEDGAQVRACAPSFLPCPHAPLMHLVRAGVGDAVAGADVGLAASL